MTNGAEHRDPWYRAARDETLTLEGPEKARPSGPALHRGQLLGRYVVLNALGTGGMGSVYAAFDPELDRKVALKVLRNDLRRSDGDAAQARLRREAQAIARLAHPNVVAVYDVGTVDERLFIAMEIIEGSNLVEWLDGHQRNWREVVGVYLQAGRGLAAAHNEDLIHRDFKPSNVMVGVDGRVRVLDFGLAREMASPQPQTDLGSLKAPAQSDLTTFGVLGTPAYVAPELRGGAPPDTRSDQYSFCLSLYESLNGELPGGVAAAGGTEGFKIPRWLRRLVSRGLSEDPAKRFPSMTALLAALEKGVGRRSRQWLAATALMAIAISALGVWLSAGSKSTLLCQGAERRLEGIWDAPRKAAGFAAFENVGQPFAVETWKRVAAALDSYTGAWTHLHVEACESTHLRGEQSEEMLDLQMACLDRRLQEVKAATDLLLEADEQIVLNAIKLASLPVDLGLCSDREALIADLPPPPDPETASQVSAIRAMLEESRALDNVGKYHDAHSMARAAVAEAEALPYPPIYGEALRRLSLEAARVGQRAQMVETLLQVAKIALASDHDELLANSYTHLILAHWLRGENAEARKWGELAEGAIKRLSRPHELPSQRFFFLGMVANSDNRSEEAISFFDRSLDVNPDADAFDHLVTFSNLGIAHRQLGRFDKARVYHLKGIEVARQAYGPDHPALANLYTYLGDLDRDEGDFEAALSAYRRSLAIRTVATTPDDPHRAGALNGIGHALINLRRPAEALAPLEEAIRLQEAQALDPRSVSISRFQLARALWDSGTDRRRARTLALEARDVQRTLGERAAEDLAASENWLAEHR